ncbi:hypothetical protein pb186bvf_008588 [Paramecium bursaria]
MSDFKKIQYINRLNVTNNHILLIIINKTFYIKNIQMKKNDHPSNPVIFKYIIAVLFIQFLDIAFNIIKVNNLIKNTFRVQQTSNKNFFVSHYRDFILFILHSMKKQL